MAVFLSPVGGVAAQFFDNSGNVLTGGKLYTYAAGTTTPAATYTSSSGSTAQPNPIVLDAAGRVPNSGEIWLTDGVNYKFVLKDANDVLIATYDNVSGINSNFIAFTNNQEIFTATSGQTVFTLANAYQPGTNSLSVFVDGVNQYGPGAQYAYVETDSTTVTFNAGLHVGAEVKFTTTQQQGAGAVDASQVTYDPPFTGSVVTNVEAKLAQTVSVKDFGAVGDGVTDDTAAIQAALDASYDVTVPAGLTCLISATISVPARTRLFMEGGTGNLTSNFPVTHLIKKSTMTTAAVVLADCAILEGGGLLCQVGNTGDGVQIAGNAASVKNFYVARAGNDGFRVGTDSGAVNCNSFLLDYCRSTDNGRYGFYIHDGVANDANAGELHNPIAARNGADGIRLGHCYWVTVNDAITESNTLYGLYLSGTNNNSYPECRWALIIGGDYNEGNNGTGNVDQIFDGSYFSTFIQADKYSVSTDPITALQGGGRRNTIAPTRNALQGLTVYTDASGVGANPLIVDVGTTGGAQVPAIIRQKTFAGNGTGPGLKFQIDPNTGTYVDSGKIASLQFAVGTFLMRFSAYSAGSVVDAVEILPLTGSESFRPVDNDTWDLGFPGLRWSTVYAVTGTINTSDERAKQDIENLSDAEKRVAITIKGLVKKFKYKSAVAKKGSAARIHVGVIAQDVIAAFEAEGLNPMHYGIVCYDEWDAEFDPDGKETLAAGSSYGIRYEELLAFIIGAM